MPAALRAWYTPADFEALAARQAELEGEFSVTDMSRLGDYLGEAGGSCAVRFGFSHQQPGWIGLAVELRCRLTVSCQRCLGPLELEISERAEFGLVTDDTAADILPEGIEPIELDGDRFSPMQLIEDELIIAVPMAPRHAREQCAADTNALPDGVSEQDGLVPRN